GQVITIGLDIAKSVFQVHGVDAAGEVVMKTAVGKPARLGSHAPLRSFAKLTPKVTQRHNGSNFFGSR
ncbi:MAG: hypothetical protein ACLP2E_18105, partial [Rhodoblastus sp.]